MLSKLLIFFVLIATVVYAQHYKAKIERLGLKNCEECHTTAKWNELKHNIEFKHEKTGFDLGPQHKNVDCNSCHTFKTKITEKKECKDCHFDPHKKIIKTYENKPTSQEGSVNKCEDCHKKTLWHKVEFKHEEFSKGFILDGAHKNVTCIQCHKTHNYSDAKANCVSCHETDYVKSSWPNHKKAHFNKDCVSCHTTYSWSQGRYYEHEQYFPILNSIHAGFSCKSCHNNPDDFKTITCTSCHEHSKGKTDKIHKDMFGYKYDSKSCYSCHPRGKK